MVQKWMGEPLEPQPCSSPTRSLHGGVRAISAAVTVARHEPNRHPRPAPRITVDDLADALQVSKRTIYKWSSQGKLPDGTRLPNGMRLWHHPTIDEWLHGLVA